MFDVAGGGVGLEPRVFDGGGGLKTVGDVPIEGRCAGAYRSHLGGYAVAAVGVQVHGADGRTGPRQRNGDRAAHASTRAGHNRDAIREIESNGHHES